MAKHLSVTTYISDLENYLSDIHSSCGSFRTKLDLSFLPRHILFIYVNCHQYHDDADDVDDDDLTLAAITWDRHDIF